MNILKTILKCIALRDFSLFFVLKKECPIDIKIISTKNKAHFIFNSNGILYISIGSMDRKKRRTALLHEIGHYIDFKSFNDPAKANKAFSSRKQDRMREKIAWKHAIRLSDLYDIEICYESAKRWLGSYGATYKVLENRIGDS